MSAPLADLVRVEDPDFYDEHQFAVYDRLRTEAPAFHYEPLDVHVLTRMDDVRAVSTRPEIFSNTGGLTLNQLRLARNGSAAAFERFNEPDGELVITKDPPRQRRAARADGAVADPALPRGLPGPAWRSSAASCSTTSNRALRSTSSRQWPADFRSTPRRPSSGVDESTSRGCRAG